MELIINKISDELILGDKSQLINLLKNLNQSDSVLVSSSIFDRTKNKDFRIIGFKYIDRNVISVPQLYLDLVFYPSLEIVEKRILLLS